MIHKKKKELRKKVQEIRDSLNPERRRYLSLEISENLWSIPEFTAAETLFFFLSFRSEVDTGSMIQRALARGKRVCIPYTNMDEKEMTASRILNMDGELQMGSYDILEPKPEYIRPVPPGEIDAILMPGVAFDPQGGRLGYGGGYYDRFLEKRSPQCLLIALAFELQVVEHVPCADHDIHVNRIVTEKRIIDCPPARLSGGGLRRFKER